MPGIEVLKFSVDQHHVTLIRSTIFDIFKESRESMLNYSYFSVSRDVLHTSDSGALDGVAHRLDTGVFLPALVAG